MSMKPRVTGGTPYGGTDLVLLCPRRVLVDVTRKGEYHDEPCEAELDAVDTYGLLTHAKECPYCEGEFTDDDRAALQKQAKYAIDNYDPTDAELASYYAQGESAGEVQERQARIQRELKR